MIDKHKHHDRPNEHGGVRYGSKAEAAHAMRLERRRLAGEIRWILRQVPIMIGEPGVDKPYRVDFVVCGKAGDVWAEEVKGVETAAFKRQKRQWAKRGPFPLRVIFSVGWAETIKGGGRELKGRTSQAEGGEGRRSPEADPRSGSVPPLRGERC